MASADVPCFHGIIGRSAAMQGPVRDGGLRAIEPPCPHPGRVRYPQGTRGHRHPALERAARASASVFVKGARATSEAGGLRSGALRSAVIRTVLPRSRTCPDGLPQPEDFTLTISVNVGHAGRTVGELTFAPFPASIVSIS